MVKQKYPSAKDADFEYGEKRKKLNIGRVPQKITAKLQQVRILNQDSKVRLPFLAVLSWLQNTLQEPNEENVRSALEQLPFTPEQAVIDFIIQNAKTALERCELGALTQNNLDFTDQIWLPGRLKLDLPKDLSHFEWLVIDEAQDLNPAQLYIIKKVTSKETISLLTKINQLVEASRHVLVVGDRYQSIYSFRGVSPDTMDQIEQILKAKNLTVSLYFVLKTKFADVETQCLP